MHYLRCALVFVSVRLCVPLPCSDAGRLCFAVLRSAFLYCALLMLYRTVLYFAGSHLSKLLLYFAPSTFLWSACLLYNGLTLLHFVMPYSCTVLKCLIVL